MWKAYEARQDNYWNYWISGLDLPIQNEQQDQGGQVRRGNVGFLLEAEEDGDHNQAGDDVVALSPQSNEKNCHFFTSVIRNFETQEHMEKKTCFVLSCGQSSGASKWMLSTRQPEVSVVSPTPSGWTVFHLYSIYLSEPPASAGWAFCKKPSEKRFWASNVWPLL